jgi:hypothetical protein
MIAREGTSRSEHERRASVPQIVKPEPVQAEQSLGILDSQVRTAVPAQRGCLYLSSDVPCHKFHPVGIGQGIAAHLCRRWTVVALGGVGREVCAARVSATSLCT